MTCLCSHKFIAAESFMSPLNASSLASDLRFSKLLSMSSSFIKSTMEVRQFSFSMLTKARSFRTFSTST